MKIFLYGEPGCGKTTIALNIIYNLETEAYVRSTQTFGLFKTLQLIKEDKTIWVPGVFDGSLFQGTDRLSMAVQPVAINFIQSVPGNYFIEGDRLFKPSFFEEVEFDHIFIIEASPEACEERRRLRGSKQSESWIRSKRTSIKTIKDNFPTVFLKNETDTDRQSIENIIFSKLT